jgi:hypothetical protein
MRAHAREAEQLVLAMDEAMFGEPEEVASVDVGR